MTLPVKMEFIYDKRGCYSRGDPFSIVFVYPYPEFGKPFIVKGGIVKIDAWLEKFICPAILHVTFWYHGSCRTNIRFHKIKGVYLFDRSIKSDSLQKILEKAYIQPTKRFVLLKIEGSKISLVTTFDKLPRKWVRELNPYVSGQKQPPITRRRLIQI